MNPLQVRNLTKKFTSTSTAVDHISFELKRGETLGILGANGAGKTTTISMLLGLLTPTAGAITYFGKDFFKHRSEIMQQVGSGTAYAQLPTQLTIFRNLDIFGRLYGIERKARHARIQELLEKLGMWHFRNRKTSGLSAGEMTRIILAKAFLHTPSVVLLDEPTASLDIDIAQTIRRFIKEQQGFGKSFIITSHNMHEMTEVCDRILVMQDGKIIAASTPYMLAKSTHQTTLSLMVGNNIDKCVAFAQEKGLKHTIIRSTIEIEIDEQNVAAILTELASRSIAYSDIEIRKPSLEDYFLELQRKRRKKPTS
ncbi:MAG: ABC-type transport system, ATP-binding component [candidate division TM6 bacterium GW2011_GWF2_43_87]|nr:MAG: ABC-type transport system, ATP-binding component [candidate division TM6 bacterium GW2011_GWF2_43_87]